MSVYPVDTEGLERQTLPCSAETKRMILYSYEHLNALEVRVDELEQRIQNLENMSHSSGGGQGGVGLTLYGRVNQWYKEGTDVLTQDLNAIVNNHVCGYMIEMLPWTPGSNVDVTSTSVQNNIISRYNWLVDECRRRDLMLFVSIINDNYTKNKYLVDGHRQLTQSQLETVGTRLLDAIIAKGPNDVWVQPVAETENAGTWEANVCRRLAQAGFVTVYNGSGGRPDSVPPGYNFRAWHPNNTSHWPTDNVDKTLIISDTGSIICELAGHDPISSDNAEGYLTLGCDTSKTTSWKESGTSKGFPIIGYYDFVRRSHNAAAIGAMSGIAGHFNGNGTWQQTPIQFMADEYPALWCYSANRNITGGAKDGTISVTSISKGTYNSPGSISFASHPSWVSQDHDVEANLDWVVLGVKVPGDGRYHCGFFESTSGLPGRLTRSFNNIWGDPTNNGFNYGGWDRAYFARATEYIVAYFKKGGSKRTAWFHGTFS